jgi:hypothetical protein
MNEPPPFDPDQWELCADQCLLMIESMLAEGFTLADVIAGLSYALADAAQSARNEA